MNVSNSTPFTKELDHKLHKNFIDLINGDEYGFYHVNKRSELIEQTKEVFQNFSHCHHFVQIGIGGSSLGPEMLVSALKSSHCTFSFLNNIDPDYIKHELEKVDLDKTIFYVVSKSGGTAETMAAFAIVTNILLKNGLNEKQLKDKFVFATDPIKSDLLNLGKSLGVTCLEVPSNVGGRFCALTPVGYLPALFAGLNIDQLCLGAEEAKAFIESHDFSKIAQSLVDYQKKGVSQTVLMPYSSKLRDFSSWFVQLWAESLGKKYNKQGDVVHTGLTPIASYGATDQHSQVQLFMEGPLDKLVFFIEVKKFNHDYELKNSFKAPTLKKLSRFSLSELMKAELIGTQKALKDQFRPYMTYSLDELNEKSLGGLILFFESLTVYVGLALEINPFDQPGVEAGKKYAFKWLDSQEEK